MNFGRHGWKNLRDVLKAYRFYWLSPIVIGVILLGFLQIFGDSETLGGFYYFN